MLWEKATPVSSIKEGFVTRVTAMWLVQMGWCRSTYPSP